MTYLFDFNYKYYFNLNYNFNYNYLEKLEFLESLELLEKKNFKLLTLNFNLFFKTLLCLLIIIFVLSDGGQ